MHLTTSSEVRTVLLANTFVLVFLFAAPFVQAREVTWTGLMDDFWDVNDNWIDDELPPQMLQPFGNDNAIIPVLGTPTVRFLEQINNLDNAGTIQVNSTLQMFGGDVTNTGTINIGDGSEIVSQMIIDNLSTLSGNGEVVLLNSDNTGNSSATLRGSANSENPTTHELGHTIRGEGNLSLHWINDSTIRAEETNGESGAVLRITNATIANSSNLRSSATAMLEINGTINNGANGQVIADTQAVNLRGGSITGGSLEATGGGVFDANGLNTLSGVTVYAPIDNTNTSGPINDARLYVDSGGLTNNSTITLEGTSGRNSHFGFTAPGETLDGSGEIVLVGGNNQTFIAVFPGISHPFTQGANHTIRGAGAIGTSITNNGTIRAEPGTDSATLVVPGPQTNNSRLEAGADATLLFTSSLLGAPQVTQSAGGVIAALDGGTVELAGGSYSGGSFDTAGSGEITLTGNPTLTDVANRGTFNAPGGRTVRIAGSSFTNDGAVTLNSNNSNSIGSLLYTEDITIAGTGEVVLQPAPGGTRVAPFGGDHMLTNGADHTIRGTGFLSGTVVNEGKLEGASAAEPLTVFAALSGDGPLENVQISASVFQGFSVHSPGNSTAVVPLSGSYEITFNGTLDIELGGTTPGTEHDQLDSTGTVDIDGGLTVSLIDLDNGYIPTAGDRFDIITSTNNDISGTFRDPFVDLPEFGLGYELTWQPIDYSDPRKVTLELASVEVDTEDLNRDGFVDGLDLGILLGNWNQNVSPSEGELDGTQPVDGLDLGILLGAWRPPPTSLAALHAVPEPGSLTAMLLCWCGLLASRAKRH